MCANCTCRVINGGVVCCSCEGRVGHWNGDGIVAPVGVKNLFMSLCNIAKDFVYLLFFAKRKWKLRGTPSQFENYFGISPKKSKLNVNLFAFTYFAPHVWKSCKILLNLKLLAQSKIAKLRPKQFQLPFFFGLAPRNSWSPKTRAETNSCPWHVQHETRGASVDMKQTEQHQGLLNCLQITKQPKNKIKYISFTNTIRDLICCTLYQDINIEKNSNILLSHSYAIRYIIYCS